MRALLDTQAFLWWTADHPSLPAPVRAFISEDSNEILLSVITAWEMVIKSRTHHLPIPPALVYTIAEVAKSFDFKILPVLLEHAVRVASLPFHHKDPFDRMLIAQAQIEGVPLISNDFQMQKYNVEVMW